MIPGVSINVGQVHDVNRTISGRMSHYDMRSLYAVRRLDSDDFRLGSPRLSSSHAWMKIQGSSSPNCALCGIMTRVTSMSTAKDGRCSPAKA